MKQSEGKVVFDFVFTLFLENIIKRGYFDHCEKWSAKKLPESRQLRGYLYG